jgi:transcriptional regulator with XRE-family HTH domain
LTSAAVAGHVKRTMEKIFLGNAIRDARLEKGLTQLELAKALGYSSPQFVYLMERNVSKVPLEILGKLIVILGLEEAAMIDILLSDFRKNAAEQIAIGKKQVRKLRAR